MKIHVEDIKDTEKDAAFVEDVCEINEALAKSGPVDYQFRGGVPVNVSFYRLGSDLFFQGRFQGQVSGTCARCLESYPFTLGKDFTFVLKPQSDRAQEGELTEEDLVVWLLRGRRGRPRAPGARVLDSRSSDQTPVPRRLPRPVSALRRESQCRRVRLPRNVERSSTRGAARPQALSRAPRSIAASTRRPPWLYRSEERPVKNETSDAPTTPWWRRNPSPVRTAASRCSAIVPACTVANIAAVRSSRSRRTERTAPFGAPRRFAP